jgi:hypothetical protein
MAMRSRVTSARWREEKILNNELSLREVEPSGISSFAIGLRQGKAAIIKLFERDKSLAALNWNEMILELNLYSIYLFVLLALP